MYRLASWTRTTLEKASSLREPGLIVRDLGGGALGIWGLRFVEVEPWLFQDAAGEERVAFKDGLLVTEELFAGNQTWEKVPWTSSGVLHREALAALLILSASALVLRPRREAQLFETAEEPPPARRAIRVAAVSGGLHLAFAVLLLAGFLRAAGGAGLLYGVPPLVKAALVLPLLALLLIPVLLRHAVRAWKEGWWSPRWRLWYSLVVLAAVTFPILLAFSNLLGFRY